MSSFLNKLLAATGLTRRGQLQEATAAIQRALASATAPMSPPASAASSAAASVAPDADVLDGLVHEVEEAESAPIVMLEEAESAPIAVLEAQPGATLDEAAPLAERRATSRFTESSFTGASGTRSFKLFEPAGFDASALPLVVMLHGCTQDPDDFAAGTRMNTLAQEQGLFVLYPAQAPRSNAQKCWNWFVPGDQRRGNGEPALLAGMVRHVMETHAVDADRVYVAGLSAGGAMAAILAREYPDLFAAAGVHSGLAAGAAHDLASALQAMRTGAAAPSWPAALGAAGALRTPLVAWPRMAAAGVEGDAADAAQGAPLIVFHGDADPTVHSKNGTHIVDAALGSAAAWQTRREPGTASSGRAFTRTVYRDAASPAGAPSRAEHWIVHGAAHAWSGGSAAGSYTESAGPDASREMLRFFAEHPRSSRSR